MDKYRYCRDRRLAATTYTSVGQTNSPKGAKSGPRGQVDEKGQEILKVITLELPGQVRLSGWWWWWWW